MNVGVDLILRFLLKQNVIENDEDSIAYCRYGIEITISSLFNVLLILIIGVLFEYVLLSILFLLIFINMRRYTGGYHASTYLGCNTALCVSYIILCLITKNIVDLSFNAILIISIVLHAVSLGVIALYSPLENENKPLTSEVKSINHTKSITFEFLVCLTNLILLYFRCIESVIIALTVFLVAILMIIKLVKEGKV